MLHITKDAAENLGNIGTRKSLSALHAAMQTSRFTDLVAIRNAIEAIGKSGKTQGYQRDAHNIGETACGTTVNK